MYMKFHIKQIIELIKKEPYEVGFIVLSLAAMILVISTSTKLPALQYTTKFFIPYLRDGVGANVQKTQRA